VIWSPWREPVVRLAAAFAAVAVIAALTSVAAVLRPVRVTAAPTLALPSLDESAPSLREQPAPWAHLAPFTPLRGTGGEGVTEPEAAMPTITLIGTVLGGEQPAAICRLGTAAPRILHAGDTLGGWRLVDVAPARAVFIDAARARHELRLSPPGN